MWRLLLIWLVALTGCGGCDGANAVDATVVESGHTDSWHAEDAAHGDSASPVDRLVPDGRADLDSATTADARVDATATADVGADASRDAGADAGLGADAAIESIAVVVDCTLPPMPQATDINYALDIEYNVAGNQSLRLDIAWPKTAGPHPLVVNIHGGGWVGGDKSGYRTRIAYLASLGFAAASINYRLVNSPNDGDNPFPAAVQDVRCALRWLRANAANYAIDPTRVAAFGGSAGGHLSAMLGAASDLGALSGTCATTGQPIDVSAVVSYAGPQDLRDPTLTTSPAYPHLVDFLGCAPPDCPAIAALASPQEHVDPSDPPFLLCHGDADTLAPLSQSQNMRAALWAAQVPATLVVVPGLGHEDFELATPPANATAAVCTSLAFLRQQLRL